MAEELKSTLGVDAELIKKSGGIFEVYKDGQLVFSKVQLGRFPQPGEVLKILKA
ncbi:MAG: Rdx family protein [Blastopirellula sp.]|nr:Rdx family protein [Blastopirellula sp.]